jgi:hypothetical protein
VKRAIVSFMFIIAYERNEWTDMKHSVDYLPLRERERKRVNERELEGEEDFHFLPFLVSLYRETRWAAKFREKNYVMKKETSD